MGNEMIRYLQELEILAFFSGYPLVYAIVGTIRGNALSTSPIRNKVFELLPVSYAIIGLLYLGLQLRNLYPDFSFQHISSETRLPFYSIWGVLSLLFLLTALNRKPVISLLHSLVFFF